MTVNIHLTRIVIHAVFTTAVVAAAAGAAETNAPVRSFSGAVFEDTNRNGVRDAGEPGVPRVAVSNGRQVTLSDDNGAYSLPVRPEMVVFVSKPASHALPLDKDRVPRFYYVHSTDGSPNAIRKYDGLTPTGPLPDPFDFPLLPAETHERFTTWIIGDTQVSNYDELLYLRDSLIAELAAAEKASFAICLGDNVDNDLSLYPRYLRLMSMIGVPIHYVPGNHDLNRDSPDDAHTLDTYRRFLGPTYYSFNVGKVHFVVLDSVMWDGAKRYHGEIDADQIAWLEADLDVVPADRLIVLNMHIPLISRTDMMDLSGRHWVTNRHRLYQLLKGRQALALSGHTHTLERFTAGETLPDRDERTPFPQILAGAACGSWWNGTPDGQGIPNACQRDGSPRGYLVFDFDGADYSLRYKGIGMPEERQMNLSFASDNGTPLPRGMFRRSRLSTVTLVANVWTATGLDTITCRFDDRKPVKAVHNTNFPDPFALRLQKSMDRDHQTTRSPHLWTCPLPTDLETGVHQAIVSFPAGSGRIFSSTILFEVTE